MLVIRHAIFNLFLFCWAVFGFRSDLAVDSSGQAALVGFEEDAGDFRTSISVNVDTDAVVAVDEEGVARSPDLDARSARSNSPLDVSPPRILPNADKLPEGHFQQVTVEGSAPPPLTSPQHTARPISVARAAYPEASSSEAIARSAAATPIAFTVASNPPGTPIAYSEFDSVPATSGDRAVSVDKSAPSPAAPGDRSGPMLSLLEGRVSAWASRTAAQVATRSRSVPGGWAKFLVAAFLVALMIFCARPCAAAFFPARSASAPKKDRPRKRPLPKSVMVGKRGLTHQEKMGDLLADIACSDSDNEAEKGPSASLSLIVSSTFRAPPETAPAEDPERSRCNETKLVVSDVSSIAKQLQTVALKYPKSGRSGLIFGNKAQKRFFLVLKQPDGEASKKRSDGSPQDPTRELILWRAGRLAWWETEASFQKKDKPKGSIKLSEIHDVQKGEEPMSVVVEHQDRDSKCTLELQFSSGDASKTWSARFRELLVKLNTEIG